MIYKINPFPAVRVNGKGGRYTPRAIQYHEKIKALRSLVWNPEPIMKALIKWNYELVFYIEMPKSWSNKKRLEMEWKPHRQTPDGDNLYKAFTDTVFYNQKKYNDKEIFDTKSKKFWSNTWYIEFNEKSAV